PPDRDAVGERVVTTPDPVRTLREDMILGGITGDPFSVGDVIRWTVSGGYTYAAIKTPVGWFTTARENNMYVRQTYRYLDLVTMLVKRDVVDLDVSAGWRKVQ